MKNFWFILFLVGCNDLVTEQCAVDLIKNECYCREYIFSVDALGPIGESKNVNFLHCHKMIGYTPDNYSEVSTFLEKVRRRIKEETSGDD